MQTDDAPAIGIRLGLVEPCALSRDLMACAFSFQPDLEVQFAGSGIHELPGDMRMHDVDVLVLTLSFHGRLEPPATLLAPYRSVYPHARTVVLSDTRVYTTISALLRWGIDGYLIWDTIRLVELIDAVRTVAEGSLVLCPTAREILYRDGFNGPRLSAKELEVVRALAAARDYSRKEAAAMINVGYKTFNVHVRNILAKLGTYGGGPAIVERCRELGLIDPQLTPPSSLLHH
jgi:DNA-binding NarL/FixJ family response regulator